MSDTNEKKRLFEQIIPLVDNWLDFQTYIKELPGLAIGIFVENEVIFQKEYGYANLANKKKLTNKHLFRIASHSKLFTATAIMQLYHEEKLSLDDRIIKYLPWFVSEEDKNLEHITIRHLLTHSSGISRDGTTAHWSTYQFPEKQQIIDQVHKGISFFETSELLKYSNLGYTLLGQIIEKITGLTYHEFIRKNILEPLAMTDTVTQLTEKNIPKHTTGYKIKFPGKEREPLDHVPAKVMHAATGLSSNVQDMIRFYQGHFMANDQLLPDYIKREMQRTQYRSKKVDWGLGFSIVDLNGAKLVGHGGGYPGFITRSGLIKGEKIIIVILTNAIDGPAANLLTGIYKLFHYFMKEKNKYLVEEPEELPDWKEITGFYESDWGVSLFSQIGEKLALIAPAADNPVENIQIFDYIENLTFKAPKEPYSASPGQEIAFIDGPDGEKIFVDSHKGKNKRFTYSY